MELKTIKKQITDFALTVDNLTLFMEEHPDFGLLEPYRRLQRSSQQLLQSPFTVLVVGSTNVGKSSLINAILEEQVLPTSIVPDVINHPDIAKRCKSVIYADTYDPVDEKTPFNSSLVEMDFGESSISVHQYKSKSQFASNRIQIVEAPSFDLDLRSLNINRVLAHTADVIIFVSNATALLKSTEKDFLDYLITQNMFHKVVVAVTKFDFIAQNEVMELKNYAERQFQTLGVAKDTSSYDEYIFYLSAKYNSRIDSKSDDPSTNQGLHELKLKVFQLLDSAGRKKLALLINQLNELTKNTVEELELRQNLLSRSQDEYMEFERQNRQQVDLLIDYRNRLLRQINAISEETNNIILRELVDDVQSVSEQWESFAKELPLRSSNQGELEQNLAKFLSEKSRIWNDQIDHQVKKSLNLVTSRVHDIDDEISLREPRVSVSSDLFSDIGTRSVSAATTGVISGAILGAILVGPMGLAIGAAIGASYSRLFMSSRDRERIVDLIGKDLQERLRSQVSEERPRIKDIINQSFQSVEHDIDIGFRQRIEQIESRIAETQFIRQSGVGNEIYQLEQAIQLVRSIQHEAAEFTHINQEDTNESKCDDVHFSAYFPREAHPEKRYSLLVYAHLLEMRSLIDKDVAKFQDELGGEVPRPKSTKKAACIKQGTPLTVMIECEDIEFEPFALTKKWRGNWARFEFDFQVPKEMVNDTVILRVSIRAYGIEIACIEKCAFDVVEESQSAEHELSLDDIKNPIALAKYSSQSAEMHKQIFVSYAREDTDIVESYRLAQEARGDDVFMDTYSIRAGEDWKKALAHAIDTVDIFQLFWSEHSSQSEFVQHEWDYAMTFRCKEDECRDFIRPVYWKKPMPDPPEQLSHLNFAFVPFGLAGESLEWRLYHDEFWDRMETYFDESNVILKRTLRDLKRGQRAIYRRLERNHADELNAIMNALQDGKFEQIEMAETLQGIERTLMIMRKYNARLDKRVREAVDDLTEAVESNLGMQQKLELALPIIPFFLDYKVELGAGSDVDLNKVWDELKERWSRLVNRIRGQEN